MEINTKWITKSSGGIETDVGFIEVANQRP